ncbi:MFS allantoate transporter [Lecanosticta acicola]|uniref:MFS allantoate transporter n=1 Tax=Lecanosticta acicola TaxID=111012 RepID=A0AAI8Z1M3_9PEZI|nr:MFS allantoate transporter [Lecanosticta acicola]
MGLFKRSAIHADAISSPPPTPPAAEADAKIDVVREETADCHQSQWKLNKAGNGDAAMTLFNSPEEIHEPVDSREEERLFYFGFLAWALPTNLLLQRLPVGKYLGSQIFLWGFFLMLQAVAKKFSTLAALRALAGAAEACSDPAFMLVTAMWYTRRQQPIRMGLWYTANGLGIALGGLLGFGIGNIKGKLASWKYEFLIVGALCCIWGIVMMIFLPDSPVTAKGLSPREKRIAVERLREDQTGVENKRSVSPSHVPSRNRNRDEDDACVPLQDYKLYLFYLLGLVSNVPNGGISNFGTLILHGFGFPPPHHHPLLQIPYGVLIALSILCCVYTNDYLSSHGSRQTRCYAICLFLAPNLAGALGLRFLPPHPHPHNSPARLACYYLTGPYNAAFCLLLSLTTANTAGHTKKVLTNAVIFLGYCTGKHRRGLLARENRKRDAVQSLQAGGLEGRDLDATAFGDLTDRENLNFRYIY